MQKKYIYLMLPVLVGGVLMGGVVYANAFGMGGGDTGIVQAIAQKFSLNEADVQKVFEEQRVKMHSQMQAKGQQMFTERLKTLVAEGKLTQVQADKIVAKKTELQSQMLNMQGKTQQEIVALRKSHMDTLKQWATDNNIPLEYMMGQGMGQGGGRGGKGMGQPKGI